MKSASLVFGAAGLPELLLDVERQSSKKLLRALDATPEGQSYVEIDGRRIPMMKVRKLPIGHLPCTVCGAVAEVPRSQWASQAEYNAMLENILRGVTVFRCDDCAALQAAGKVDG